ncbi:phosphatidate phosphatase PAH1-like isoform X1 [Iris pallida]|uniref:phosphatidate phosphatase n=1 Tax=Iris pallida TaxID=29817 RepID=A0AAX6DPH4_IRIPA|nr:phosphatidate phosphatase PAH1-like isoform X1 [Iris pallida]KAJ6831172.1 phosphatidate phosphatase PAH1-like isoform X1 [Iris pallida]
MNVVGKVGSLITQGVYSVATPFHPFGGAVDIIVVEQEDGTYRSTPWYVRFGKFQGFMKSTDKLVSISVNGVEANFQMYLDHSGQAYFMREVDLRSNDTESAGRLSNASNPIESNQNDAAGDGAAVHETIYEGGVEEGDHSYRRACSMPPSFGSYGYGDLEEVEDMVQSSNDSNSEMVLVSVDGHVLTAPISSDEQNSDNVQSSNPKFHLGPVEGAGENFDGLFADLDAASFNDIDISGHQLVGTTDGKRVTFYDQDDRRSSCGDSKDIDALVSGCDEASQKFGHGDRHSSSEDIRVGKRNDDLFKSCLDLTLHNHEGESHDLVLDQQDKLESSPKISHFSEMTVEVKSKECESIDKPDELKTVCTSMKDSENNISVGSNQEVILVASDLTPCTSDLPCSEGFPTMDHADDSSEKILAIEDAEAIATSTDLVSSDMHQMDNMSVRSTNEGECSQTEEPGQQRSSVGLGFEISLCANLLRAGMGHSSAKEAFEAHRISEEKFKASGPSIVKDANLIVRFEERYFPWDKAAYIVLGKASFGSDFSGDLKDWIPVENEETKAREDAFGVSPSTSRRWRLWPNPFRRAVSLEHSNSNSSSEEFFVDSESGLESPNAEVTSNAKNHQSPRKHLLRTYIPTTEQIASLNLKDGQNIIAFSFFTRVLGKQEVDAHIYLWKWNARIVISDVDGTITKSDVLGQVMPLVGKDWTQCGVAGLFSAIKENGYQLLFLSARAIVQAYLTRSFLLNLKQDGKALPSGPVVISPDGLFPSLYREVIRRAPHEFKIACLEDIRALFPSDYNPFYAGFGNRDTDELSYRKIGIPKGKIFIINPKGEVAINHCVDVKSYTSLHTLVNDMFPPTSLVEQEDFNSWNYWKMPLPTID